MIGNACGKRARIRGPYAAPKANAIKNEAISTANVSVVAASAARNERNHVTSSTKIANALENARHAARTGGHAARSSLTWTGSDWVDRVIAQSPTAMSNDAPSHVVAWTPTN